MLFIVLSAVSFLLGVATATLSGWHLGFYWVFFALIFLWKKPAWGAVVLFFLVGFGRFSLWQSSTLPLETTPYFEVDGVLAEDWGKREGKWSWLLQTDTSLLLVKLSAYESFAYGDRLHLEGELQSVVDFTDSLSYVHYLQRYGVQGVMEQPRVHLLEQGSFSLLGFVLRFSKVLALRLQTVLPEPESGFAVGLLLGQRQTMSQTLTDAFQTVGLTHIVAISGSNITMVIVALSAVSSFLSHQKRLLVSGIGVVFFVLLVGPSASVLRAAIMGVLMLWGLYGGRRSQAYFGLLWTAVLMVVFNPLVLSYDVGFQLSFASTLGILTLQPLLDRCLPAWLPFKESLVLTLAAQLMTFPFIVFYFGRFSWVTPFANVMVAPLIPLAMAFSGLSLIFGPPAGAVAWTFLWLIENIALLCASLPGVQIDFSVSEGCFLILLLALCAFLLLSYKSKLARAFLRDP